MKNLNISILSVSCKSATLTPSSKTNTPNSLNLSSKTPCKILLGANIQGRTCGKIEKLTKETIIKLMKNAQIRLFSIFLNIQVYSCCKKNKNVLSFCVRLDSKCGWRKICVHQITISKTFTYTMTNAYKILLKYHIINIIEEHY